jgi:hypothetical protein
VFDSRATAPLGKVIHDDRGNAIWDWAIETGVLAKATAAELARTLANPFVLELEVSDASDWSGDPYNRSQR